MTTTSATSSLTIPRRFNGPPPTGNGGWVAGALAARLSAQVPGRAITVTLRQPPPLDVPLPLSVSADDAVISHDGRPVAEAVWAAQDPTPVDAVSVDVAVAAEAGYLGHRVHPFPGCFVCGPDRRPGDGLRIFAGPVPGGDGHTVAATWTPYESSIPITWAALDCPGGWSSDLEGRPSLLGRITVQIYALPTTSQRYVVVGEQRVIDGRKTVTAASLRDTEGRLLATAEHVWITVDPSEFR